MPIAALALIAVLQNVDVIVVRHQVGEVEAGAYAAAAVAAKVVVWTAVGVALYVIPEAAGRTAAGRGARPVLLRAERGRGDRGGARAARDGARAGRWCCGSGSALSTRSRPTRCRCSAWR